MHYPIYPGSGGINLLRMNIAILITCYNRKDKTLSCLDSIQSTLEPFSEKITVHVYMTDDGCSDGTAEAVLERKYSFPVHILKGDGELYWNGGMILAWKTAIQDGGFDGYLWVNDDILILPEFWEDLLQTDAFCQAHYGKRGIYVGSTKDAQTGKLTYGGFDFINKLTLKDRFVIPDGKSIQPCEVAHGNLTYVSRPVVDKMGILAKQYWHGGSDHDYTYLAHKAGFPILVCPRFSAICRNDHTIIYKRLSKLSFKERLKLFWSPFGMNMHNTLLFNWRCFPYRLPFVLVAGIAKCISPMKSSHFIRPYIRKNM